jgi:amino acid adenylation domain-containing protein
MRQSDIPILEKAKTIGSTMPELSNHFRHAPAHGSGNVETAQDARNSAHVDNASFDGIRRPEYHSFVNAHSRRLVHQALQASAAAAGASRTAVIAEGRPYTYGQLLGQARLLAGALQSRGLQRGERVAIFMDNTWACVVSIYAALLAGGVFLVVNPQTRADKLAFILDDSGARLLLSDTHLLETLVPAAGQAKSLRSVLLSGDGDAGALAGVVHVSTFDEALAESAAPAGSGAIPLDLAALIYTSGSTGHPKGVMQTHQSMVFATGSLIEYLRLAPTDRILCVLPLAFDYGLYQLLMAVTLGAVLVLERSFTYPAQIYQRVVESDVTVFPGVPTIYAMMVSANARTPLRFPSVRRITNTAAALPDSFTGRLREIFPNALIYRMYGLTECKRVCYLEPELVDSKPGSVGKAIPGTEVYLLDEHGSPVAPGGTGILHVRGPHVMAGYWNRPDLSDFMLKPGMLPGERVLCTHDWFRMDEEGFLYFVGRSDDIIKTRGEKVSPVEVENALHRIAGVREAAVVGIPDATLGEAVRAYIVPEPEVFLTERQVRSMAAKLLEGFMVPSEIVFCGELPKTSTGKVSKRQLRNPAA